MMESAGELFEVNAIGISTVEAVPLFHYKPGGIVGRVLAYPSQWVESECSLPFEVCEWLSSPRSYPGFMVKLSALKVFFGRWKVDAVVLDGVETWRFAGRLRIGLPLVARSQLLKEATNLDGLDALIIDVVGGRRWGERLARLVEMVNRQGLWVEVNLYLLQPSMREVEEAVSILQGLRIPLHIHIADPQGGGPVRRLYIRASSTYWPVYVHAGVFSELDTKCPKCGTYVASRHRSFLTSLALKEESRCPSCGEPLPIIGPYRRKTDELILRAMRSGGVFMDPRLFGGVSKRGLRPL